jgi:hypothetical protein
MAKHKHQSCLVISDAMIAYPTCKVLDPTFFPCGCLTISKFTFFWSAQRAQSLFVARDVKKVKKNSLDSNSEGSLNYAIGGALSPSTEGIKDLAPALQPHSSSSQFPLNFHQASTPYITGYTSFSSFN